MCYKIEPKYVLANYFSNKKIKECSPKVLYSLKKKIETELINVPVYVEVTRDSVFMDIENNPNFFKWEDNKIKKNKLSYFSKVKIENRFNIFLDKEIKDDFIRIIKDYSKSNEIQKV